MANENPVISDDDVSTEAAYYSIDYTPQFDLLHDDLFVIESDIQSFTSAYKEDVKNIITAQQTEIQCLTNQIEQQNSMIQGLGFLVFEFLVLLVGFVIYKVISSIERA